MLLIIAAMLAWYTALWLVLAAFIHQKVDSASFDLSLLCGDPDWTSWVLPGMHRVGIRLDQRRNQHCSPRPYWKRNLFFRSSCRRAVTFSIVSVRIPVKRAYSDASTPLSNAGGIGGDRWGSLLLPIRQSWIITWRLWTVWAILLSDILKNKRPLYE